MTQENVAVNTAPNSVPVPTDWASIGVESGYNPPKPENLRLLIDGPEGEGKSTFIASIPDNLIIDPSGGSSSVVKPRAHRIRVLGYDNLARVVEKLVADAKAGRKFYKRVTIDDADRWIEIIAKQAAKENEVLDIADYGAKGAGWRILRNRCLHMITELEDAGYSWSLVGHLTEKTISDPSNRSRDITVPRLAMFDTLRNPLVQSCEFHATIYCVTEEVPNIVEVKLPNRTEATKVQKGTRPESKYYFNMLSVGGRQGKKRGVPDMDGKFELPLVGGWDVFCQKYNEAVQKAKQVA